MKGRSLRFPPNYVRFALSFGCVGEVTIWSLMTQLGSLPWKNFLIFLALAEDAVANNIRAWLEGLELGEFAEAFLENGVDQALLIVDLSRKSSGYLSHLHCHRFKRERAFPA